MIKVMVNEIKYHLLGHYNFLLTVFILPNNRASKNILMTHHTYFLGLWKTQTCNVHYWRFLLHGKMQESVKTSFGIRNHKKVFLR